MYVEIIFKISIKLVERRVKQHSQMVNFYKWEMHLFCFRQKDNLMFQIERHFFCFRQKDTFFVSDRKTPQHVVQNRLPCCNFFSMRLFKYFFRQFSYKSIQEYVFQVSLKLDEWLWRYGWKKVTRKWNFIFYICLIQRVTFFV